MCGFHLGSADRQFSQVVKGTWLKCVAVDPVAVDPVDGPQCVCAWRPIW